MSAPATPGGSFTPLPGKLVSEPDRIVDAIAKLPRPLVFTNGCFDILHVGHVRYLQQARDLGASLVVGVNSDRSVRSLGKGDNRPINPLAERAEILAALTCVDLVVPFDETTPRRLIEQIGPDILVKGGDWQPEAIVGRDWVIARGGSVYALPLTQGRSTSAIIARIRSS